MVMDLPQQVILFSNAVFGTFFQVSVMVIIALFELAGTFVLNQPPRPANPISISIEHVEETFSTKVYFCPT